MKEFLSESEAAKAKQQLEDDMVFDSLDESKEYSSREINWVEDDKDWQEAREMALEKLHKDVEARERQVVEAQNMATRTRRELEERDARIRQAMGG